jgi:signal transduction histidine kinase
MRLVIDSLDPHLADLPSLLGQVRARLEPVLEGTGVRMRWEVDELPETPDWGPERLLDVLRIVQEALSNALRHAQAREIRLRAARVPGAEAIEIVIEDDGRGIDGAPPGRGLRHMRARAEALGGSLHATGGRPGTRVTLHVPRQAPRAGA